MNVQELIKKRIDRFNNLWLKAEGHTFEEDVEFCKNKIKEWQEKVDKRLSELGYKSWGEYNNAITCYDDNPTEEEIQEAESRKDSVLEELRTRPAESLYTYEMLCIDQAVKIYEFLKSKNDDVKEAWNSYTNEKTASCWDLVDAWKTDGFNGWDDGHSGNSGSMSIMFAQCMIFSPELFPYLHGALSHLVGDVGYHDDRSDLPKRKE